MSYEGAMKVFGDVQEGSVGGVWMAPQMEVLVNLKGWVGSS